MHEVLEVNTATMASHRSLHVVPDAFSPVEAQGDRAFALRHLGKRFGDKTVLDGINLDIPAGQFVAIVGKSGCGKSTLLRLLAGLDAPTSGTLVHGRNQGFDRTRFMFQEPRLLPWLSVVRNVEVGLTGIATGAQARRRALELLDQVGLADRADEWPSVLSGGQKQRVALARALVGEPRILALDEPLGALDALTRIEMQQLLEQIWVAQKFTAVLVTHDVSEAVALADRILVIENGNITLDLPVTTARPRRRGAAELARLEGQILRHLFRGREIAGDEIRGAAKINRADGIS